MVRVSLGCFRNAESAERTVQGEEHFSASSALSAFHFRPWRNLAGRKGFSCAENEHHAKPQRGFVSPYNPRTTLQCISLRLGVTFLSSVTLFFPWLTFGGGGGASLCSSVAQLHGAHFSVIHFSVHFCSSKKLSKQAFLSLRFLFRIESELVRDSFCHRQSRLRKDSDSHVTLLVRSVRAASG